MLNSACRRIQISAQLPQSTVTNTCRHGNGKFYADGLKSRLYGNIQLAYDSCNCERWQKSGFKETYLDAKL